MAVRRFRYSTRDTGGQAAVEFALVLPFLLVMLIGIVEFGRAWNQHQVITDAARESARAASLWGTTTEADVKKVATDAMAAAGIDYRRAEIDIVNLDGAGNTPVTVSIDLRYRFTFFAPLVAWATGDEIIHLKTSFAMRNE
jgi:Flp pilus assembly protein TadG